MKLDNQYRDSTTQYGIKTVVLGNYATGKTTLVNRLTTGKIKPFTESTIGCAFSSLSVISKHGTPVQYQIWDTAGQEKYRAMTELYYRNADIILICFDVADRKSFQNIQVWIDLINDGCHNDDHIRFLIANKNDLEWSIDRQRVERLAQQHNMTLIVTSALKDIGITELLETITEKADSTWRNEMTLFKQDCEKTKKTVITGTVNTVNNGNNCCY